MLLVPICVTVTLKQGLVITDIYLENTIWGGGGKSGFGKYVSDSYKQMAWLYS